MSTVNPVKSVSMVDHSHLNWMGGESWDVSDPVLRLRIAAASCFFGEPMYYHRNKEDAARTPRTPNAWKTVELSKAQLDDLAETLGAISPVSWRGMAPNQLLESAIDEALKADPEATLALAVELRNEDLIRVTPQVIMVRAANCETVRGTGLIRKYGPDILKRADEPATQLAYQSSAFPTRPIPNALKRAWKTALEGFGEYQLAKYKLESHFVKTVDVINVSHPKSPVVSKLAKGELKLTENTWESLISAKGSSTETWTQAVSLMGHMALLRNMANLLKNEVSTDLWLNKLVEGVEGGKQLPFRYYSAWKKLKGAAPARVLDALEECIKVSYANAPHFTGRTMSLCDNSGSAWGAMTSSMGTMRVAEIANLTAVFTAYLSDEGFVGAFGDRLKTMEVRKSASVMDQVDAVSSLGQGVGQTTENGIWLFWKDAIANKVHWDTVFVYSDMQAGHGGLYGTDPDDYKKYIWDDSRYGRAVHIHVPKLIADYRKQVNPNVNVFLVQVAGYQDVLVPEFYDRTYILGGWGDGILKFAGKMIGMTNHLPKQ